MLRSFFARERGQGLVEYSLILLLIAIVVLASLSLSGRRVSTVFGDVNCGLSGKTIHKDQGNGNSNRCK